MDLDPQLRAAAQGSPESSSSGTASPSSHAGGRGGQGDAQTPATDSPHGAVDDAKKARACESCRGLKVRCEPDPDDGPCKRCKKAGRNCVVTMPTRKRQKKTDSRVSELEKKIDALTASLQARVAPASSHHHHHHQPPLPTTHDSGYGGETGRIKGPPAEWGTESSNRMYGIGGPDWTHERRLSGSAHKRKAPMDEEEGGAGGKYTDNQDKRPSVAAAAAGWPAYASDPAERDIVDRGMVSMELASQLFTRFRDEMIPHLPGIVFPPEYTVMDLRRTKPTLFLSVMTAASGEKHALQRVLHKELMQTLATKVVVTGEKSLELVQALNVAVIWYWPPEYFEELKFYQLIHMGAVMALDIGLGRKTASKRGASTHNLGWRDHTVRRSPLPDANTLESRRTWLTCYYLASNTAMSLHRPNLIRWTSFMAESKDILETSPDAAPSDKYFCHLIWSHHLAEEVGTQFSMDDPAIKVNITDVRTQYALRALERDLDKYVKSVPAAEMQPTLKIGFNVLNLYMHEMALHVDPSNDHLRPPFNTDSLKDGLVGAESMSAAHINALSECLTSIDDIFDTFLAMNIASIRCLPVFNFVRVAYAVVVLMKMFFSASNSGSDLGKVINRDNMRVQHYLDSLLEKFRATAAEDKCRPAAKFLVVLAMLRSWFVKQNSDGPKPSGESNAQQQPPPQPSQPQQQPLPQQQQQQQQQPYNMQTTTANTPLELLSEVASGHESRSAHQPYLYTPSSSAAQRQSPFQDSGAMGPTQPPDLSMSGAPMPDGNTLPAWMPPNLMADMNFDPAASGVNMNILDGSTDLWYNDMFQGLPDPNLFPF